MDARPTNVRSGVAERAGQAVPTESSENFERQISEVREAEEAIIKDLQKLQKALDPENIAKLLISATRQELLKRIETMNTQSISEVSDKVITNTVEAVKSHPGSTALAGVGIGLMIVKTMFTQKETSRKTSLPPHEAARDEELTLLHPKESAKQPDDAPVRKSQSLKEGISVYMDENPLMLGVMGLSAGLILGILAGGVLEGNDLLDETRQTVRKKTRQILHETKEKAGHVIEAARKAAREEAKRQNLVLH